MKIFLILLGIFYIIFGFLTFLNPTESKNRLRNLLKEKNIKLFGVFGLIIGIILVRGASSVTSLTAPWFVIILGILGILKGCFFILAPKKKTKPFVDWWLSASDNVYKIWGVVAFLLGIILLLVL